MFLRGILAAGMVIGAVLVWGAGRSWLPAAHWSLLGAVLTDLAFVFALPNYAAKHNHAFVVLLSFSAVAFTIDAVRKYNKLRQSPA